MLREYDKFLHKKVLNPLFRMVQKLLHLNRWHLLLAVELLDIVLSVLMVAASAALFLIGDLGAPWIILVPCSMLILAARLFGEQRKRMRATMALLAQKFEEGRRAVPSEEVLRQGIVARQRRPVENVVATGMLLSFPLDWVFTDVTPVAEFYWACFSVQFCLEGLVGHLWDVDDVDPLERAFLLGQTPETQTQA